MDEVLMTVMVHAQGDGMHSRPKMLQASFAFPGEGRWISMKMPLHFYRKTDESSARQQGCTA